MTNLRILCRSSPIALEIELHGGENMTIELATVGAARYNLASPGLARKKSPRVSVQQQRRRVFSFGQHDAGSTEGYRGRRPGVPLSLRRRRPLSAFSEIRDCKSNAGGSVPSPQCGDGSLFCGCGTHHPANPADVFTKSGLCLKADNPVPAQFQTSIGFRQRYETRQKCRQPLRAGIKPVVRLGGHHAS